jgi:hypothetical protein
VNDFNTAMNSANAGAGIVPGLAGTATGSLNIVDRLPEAARARYHAINAQADDFSALNRASWERVDEAQQAVARTEARLRDVLRRPGISLDDNSTADAKAKDVAARAELKRLQAQHEARQEAGQPVRELCARLQDYLDRTLSHLDVIESAPPIAAPTLKKGQSWGEAVADARARLDKFHDDLTAVTNATLPADVAKEKARAQVAALAAKGRPNVLELIEGRERFSFSQIYSGAEFVRDPTGAVVGTSGRAGYKFNPEATLAWLFEREIADAVCRAIDQDADPASALTDEQIAKKTGQLTVAILQTEREEEALIAAAESAGVSIARRTDCDPRAVLGLSDACPAPKRSAF